MYIVTRRDLTPGQQIAQVAHAMAEIAVEIPASISKWYQESQFIVVLSVKDEDELFNLYKKLYDQELGVYSFYEPDINDELTAFAVDPKHYTEASKLLSSIPLAFQERRVKDEIIVHYNKAHNTDTSIPQWVVKHKGISHYVNHIEFKNVCFSSKETPNSEHTKGSLKFKGKLTINNQTALIE